MSTWSSISIRVVIHKSKKCSISKVIGLIFDDYTPYIVSDFDGDCYIHRVTIKYRESRERAYTQAMKLIKHLEDDYKAKVSGSVYVGI